MASSFSAKIYYDCKRLKTQPSPVDEYYIFRTGMLKSTWHLEVWRDCGHSNQNPSKICSLTNLDDIIHIRTKKVIGDFISGIESNQLLDY